MVFAPSDASYAAGLLVRAQQLYAFATTHRGSYKASIPQNTHYHTFVYEDELAWAALWLFRATGNQTYFTAAAAAWEVCAVTG